MAAKTAAELVIDVAANVDDATSGFDAVGDSAKTMTRAVDDAGETAERAGRRISISSDATDELGGKAGMATGALGALTSGFDLVGLGGSKYADALGSAALATDFLSGVGDSLTLVLESTAVKTAVAKVQMVAHAAASGASAAATGVMTAAQWALNAAMSANPIALIVIALVALVAGLVLAYRKSDDVRAIVNAVGRAGAEAFGWIVDKVHDVIDWVGTRLPGSLDVAKGAVRTAFDVMTIGPRILFDVVTGIVNGIGRLPKLFGDAVEAAGNIGDKLAAPFKALADFIDKIVSGIGKIKLPHIPGLRTAGDAGVDTTASSSAGTTQISIVVQGALDPYATAEQIRLLLARYDVTFALS